MREVTQSSRREQAAHGFIRLVACIRLQDFFVASRTQFLLSNSSRLATSFLPAHQHPSTTVAGCAGIMNCDPSIPDVVVPVLRGVVVAAHG